MRRRCLINWIFDWSDWIWWIPFRTKSEKSEIFCSMRKEIRPQKFHLLIPLCAFSKMRISPCRLQFPRNMKKKIFLNSHISRSLTTTNRAFFAFNCKGLFICMHICIFINSNLPLMCMNCRKSIFDWFNKNCINGKK